MVGKYALFLILLYEASSGFSQSQKENEKYNILWLSCEDINPVISCYGAPGVETPNIDRLAKEGIRYTHAYSTVGVCAPSRSSIITAMYPVSIGTQDMRTGPHYRHRDPDKEIYNSNVGIIDSRGRNVPEYSAVPPDYVKCFTEYLRAAGYFCTNNSKCDYQINCPLTAWDEVSDTAEYFHRPEGMPFFAVYNHDVTHESRIWMKKNDPLLVNKESVPVPAYYPDIPVVRQDVARNYSNIEELDQQIGEWIEKLEKEGLLDKTIIFFWSDHGGPLLRQKRAVGNSGLHVPLIVRFPDKRMAGKIVDDIVSLMDLGPTVLSIAGIEPPSYMHGKAFLGRYKTKEPHQYAFGSADRFDESRDMTRSVIDGRFVYIRNFYPELPLIYRNKYREQIEMTDTLIRMDQRGELHGNAAYIFMKSKPVEELYDLKYDPYEMKNIAGDQQYATKLQELRKALSNWQSRIGDKGFIPEYDMVEMMWPGTVQPTTGNVRFLPAGKNLMELTCPTAGASIAYQMNDSIGTNHWQLFHEPIKTERNTKIVARAVRLGYQTSEKCYYPLQ